jgi:hypothetical protein
MNRPITPTKKFEDSEPNPGHQQENTFVSFRRSVRAWARTLVLFLKVFPFLPSRPIDWVTGAPVIEKVQYPHSSGTALGELYRPPTKGPHPGILVCLGVVPFEVDHPQVPVLGRALSRAGFAALLYWSPAMRDFRMDPVDVEDIALAYDWLIHRPDVNEQRSGLLGTCVGGSFALLAAAHPLVRDHVRYLMAYAPFTSMETFAQDIASSSCTTAEGRKPWKVDQITRKVFVHSLTSVLDAQECERLRRILDGSEAPPDPGSLSSAGEAVYTLLTADGITAAQEAIRSLPAELKDRLRRMSPLEYVDGLRTPLIALLHDRGDQVIPVGESRRLVTALAGYPGLAYTEMEFQHLDPVKGKLPLFKLLREFGKFIRAVYPLIRQSER